MNQAEQEIETIFQLFCEAAPNLKRLHRAYGSYSMADYLQMMLTSHRKKPRQPVYPSLKRAFYRACQNYASPIIGPEKTGEMLRMLDEGIVSTANHMGVDTVGAYLQGNILFGAMMHTLQPTNSVIPLLAAATVPLTNSTFPKGFVFRNDAGDLVRLPFFPSKYDNHFVCNAPALCPEHIEKLEKKLARMKDCYLQETIRSVVNQYYGDETLFSLENYMQQITWLNYKLSGGLIQGGSLQFVYLPMEKIASDVMVEQIADINSPVYAMLFEPTARTAILDIIRKDPKLPKTDYFWGISEKGHKRCLEHKEGKGYFIKAPQGEAGDAFYLCDHAEAIQEGLLSGKLIPTAYLSIMLCMLGGVMHQTIGGFFCIDYFQTLKQALAKFFSISYGSVPEYLMEQGVIYLCGPSILGMELNHAIYSAGLLELLYAGGITQHQLQEMLNISWKNSQLLSLQELIFDLIPEMRGQSKQKAMGLCGIIGDGNLIYKR